MSYNGTITSLPTPTRTDYSFNGWWTSSSGGTQFTTSTKVTSNKTVYAHWTKTSCTYTKNGQNSMIGTYSCQNGTATIIECRYNNILCDGGWYYQNNATYNCTRNDGATMNSHAVCKDIGSEKFIGAGYLPQTESCSCS